MQPEGKIILGIDPGSTIMGYGIIRAAKKNPELITMGVVDLHKIPEHFDRLKKIFDRTIWLIEEFKPDELAIESPFYGKNVQSMLKLGRAQGVAISAALSKHLPVYEYAPRKIKQSITGMGAASKEQVAGILQRLMDLKEIPTTLDATDGLAAAVCHYFQKPVAAEGKSYSGWKDFINKNQNKLKE